jgi:asparagine synthetase B (glutamine-hydrolysing)
MNETQFHRGPTKATCTSNPGWASATAACRSSTLETGQQPLFNEDRTWRWCSTARSTTSAPCAPN